MGPIDTNPNLEMVSLRELTDLAFGNRYRTDLAAQRCHHYRIRIVQRYRGRVGDKEPVLFIELEDLPRFLAAITRSCAAPTAGASRSTRSGGARRGR
jgi:hypothetical protein